MPIYTPVSSTIIPIHIQTNTIGIIMPAGIILLANTPMSMCMIQSNTAIHIPLIFITGTSTLHKRP